jgi:GH35 family endo-1,4-beta-xylanase
MKFPIKPICDKRGVRKDRTSIVFIQYCICTTRRTLLNTVSPRALKTEEANLVIKHFNSLTPENAMKMGPIHPQENEYFWQDADSIVAFARRHNMKVRGHTLCWHNQTPRWMFVDAAGNTVSKAVYYNG